MRFPDKANELIYGFVKQLCPEAPPPGTHTDVYLGVIPDDEYPRHTTVRGEDDTPVRCVVTGYRINLAKACRGWPVHPETVNVLVQVRLEKPLAFHKMNVLCHIDCLACVPSTYDEVLPKD